MKKLIFLILILLFVGLVNADNEWFDDVNYNQYSLYNSSNITASLLFGNLSWSYLYGYPAACPTDSFLTELGDSVICTSINPSYVNQTEADALYWRLDGSNDPPTSSWNMGGKGFEDTGNSTYNGDEYFYKKRGATMFYWNASDGTKQNYHYLDPDNNAVDYIVDLVLGSTNSLYINDVEFSKDGIFKLGGDGTDLEINNADPSTGGVLIEGGLIEADSNYGNVIIGSSGTGAQLELQNLPSCDSDSEKLETDAGGLIYCGVNPSGGSNSSFNTTYNNLLNQNCPSGSVVNGTLSNGTFICTTVSTGSANFTNVAFINGTNGFTGVNNFSRGIQIGGNVNFTGMGLTDRRYFDFINTSGQTRARVGYFYNTGANSYYWIGRNDTRPTSMSQGSLMRFYDNTPGRLEIYGDTPSIKLTAMRASGGTIIPIFDMNAISTSTNLSNSWGNIIVYGDMGSGSTIPPNTYWCAGAHNNTAFNNCTLKWNPQQRFGIAISGTTQPSYPLDVRTNVSGITINSEAAILTGGVNTTYVRATSIIQTTNASSWSGFAVCYVTSGILGHCTDAVNSTGGCTCVSN